MISIIIPCHNQEEYTKACIESIQMSTHEYELIIMDNGSDLHILEGDLAKILPECDSANIIRNEDNLGFPKAVNQGIEKAQGDVIAVLNNDVIVTPNWLEILQSHLSNGLDIVGPVTNSVSGPQQILIDQYENLESLYEAAEINRKKNEGQSYRYHRLVFFCVAIKREVIDKIGLLDEIYTPGNFEDDDFNMRAIEAGFKLGIAKDCYVHHFGSITHKAMNLDYRELLAKNQKIFNEKWAGRYKEMIRKNNQEDDIGIIFTGERAMPLDPGTPPDVMEEHWARYKYAIQFVEDKNVLDVACGAGYGADLLFKKARFLVGGDISTKTIDYCKSHYPDPIFEVFNICKIPYLDNFFDVVVSFETIEHISNGNLFLPEIVRVLVEDGTLIISCPFGGYCGNPYHLTYYQKSTFEPFLRKYFDEVKMLYQRKDKFFEDSISPEYCETFTEEYGMAICSKPKKGEN